MWYCGVGFGALLFLSVNRFWANEIESFTLAFSKIMKVYKKDADRLNVFSSLYKKNYDLPV